MVLFKHPFHLCWIPALTCDGTSFWIRWECWWNVQEKKKKGPNKRDQNKTSTRSLCLSAVRPTQDDVTVWQPYGAFRGTHRQSVFAHWHAHVSKLEHHHAQSASTGTISSYLQKTGHKWCAMYTISTENIRLNICAIKSKSDLNCAT